MTLPLPISQDLHWEEYGFENFRLVAIDTVGDGNCFFHAICQAYFIPYRTGMSGGNILSKREIVRQLRYSLAQRLGEPVDPLNPTGKIYYELLSRGKLSEFGKEIPYYSFEEMKMRLEKSVAVGNEYNEFISDQLGKDIYLLDAETQDVYITGNDDELLYKQRPSIVILYSPGHYETIGLRVSDGSIQTYFSPSHPFIEFLRMRMEQKRAGE
jgi:hypothetical protein